MLRTGRSILSSIRPIFPRFQSQKSSGPLEAYKNLVRNGDIHEDWYQLKVLDELQKLHANILEYEGSLKLVNSSPIQQAQARVETKSKSWFSFGSSEVKEVQPVVSSYSMKSRFISDLPIPKSLYLFGGTGCGKTFLMDLFFENLPIERKQRVHFHNFMIDIHKRLHKLKKSTDGPRQTDNKVANHQIEQITVDLLAQSYVICFDEFQVTDIADAMILKSLFTSLFSSGAVIIATSNRPPDDLYKNGLQRSLFLPFIDVLKRSATVYSLTDSKTDYRLVKSEEHFDNAFLFPLSPHNQQLFQHLVQSYQELRFLSPASEHTNVDDQIRKLMTGKAPSLPLVPLDLTVFGHHLRARRTVLGRRVAIFDFNDLCEEAVGAVDFIEIGRTFQVVFIENIPQMNLNNKNQLRRFITCIDALYEGHVTLRLLAQVPIFDLLSVTEEERSSAIHDELFAFDRTVSRLLEMQSRPYIEDCFQRFPQGLDLVEQVLFTRPNSEESQTRTLLLDDKGKLSRDQLDRLWNYYHIPSLSTTVQALVSDPSTPPVLSEQLLRIAIVDLAHVLIAHRFNNSTNSSAASPSLLESIYISLYENLLSELDFSDPSNTTTHPVSFEEFQGALNGIVEKIQ